MLYESDYSAKGADAMRAHATKLPKGHVKRDDLISSMLQDRNALRLIVAPHGFGKTALAREYSVRMFAGGSVAWIDASKPNFLLSLDDENGTFVDSDAAPDLIVIDDLPWLHEQRARTLSRRIDALLYGGTEVVVTAIPTCDCLSGLQVERLLIKAEYMLVREQEFASAYADGRAEGKAKAIKQWNIANERFFGRAPYVAWGQKHSAQSECIDALFSENLPISILQAMYAMLLLRSGSLGVIEEIVPKLRSEDFQMIVREYPVFGMDYSTGTFAVGTYEFNDLKVAVSNNGLTDVMNGGEISFIEKIVAMLFNRGEMQRGVRILDAFCSDEKCARWLEERGWELLDQGEILLVTSLLERCPEQAYAQSGTLQALHAWTSGLSGDSREACHISQRLMANQNPTAQKDRTDKTGLMARLALAMFSEDSIIYKDRRRYASNLTPVGIVDFLASVVDSCVDVELARAFHFDSGDNDARYEKHRRAPSKQRVKVLEDLFTGNHERLRDHFGYGMALHILAHIDSPRLHRLLQDLGCDVVVEMRRNGVKTFTQALLVRDLWYTGYFGLVGPVIDRRDVKVLDGASHMLNLLVQCCGFRSIDIPWESHASGLPGNTNSETVVSVKDGVETMHVRLFGTLEVMIGERYINEGKWRKKARGLFTMLILNLGRDVSRDEIFRQMWPDASRSNALDSFYTVWSNCTLVVGEAPYLEKNGEFCRVDPRYVKTDVAEFEQLTRHLLAADRDSNYLLDTYAKIEAVYRGSLVPSETDVNMINIQRDRYRALYVDAMVAATDCALRMSDTRVALWFARKAIEEDSEREDVYRALMKAQIAAGQRCPAIRTYFRCRDFLQSTLGLDPSLETRELYETLITTDPGLLRLDSSSFSR